MKLSTEPVAPVRARPTPAVPEGKPRSGWLGVLEGNWPHLFTVLVFASDLLLYNLAFVLALQLRLGRIDLASYWQPWLVVNLLFFPVALGTGVYRSIFCTSAQNQQIHLKRFTFYLFLFTAAYIFLVKGTQYSRAVVIIFFFTQFLLLEISHYLYHRLNRHLFRKGFGNKLALVVGTDAGARSFVEHLERTYGDYYRVQGFVANGNPGSTDPALRERILGDFDSVDRLIPRLGVTQIFIVSHSMLERKYEDLRRTCEARQISLKMVSRDIFKLMRQSKVKDVTGVPLTTPRHRRRLRSFQARVKRVFDLTFVAAASVVLVPLGLLLALLIKTTSRGPVLFTQRRSLYKGGPEFLFYKFRTMRQDADRLKEKFWSQNESDGALFKMRRDPRVTPVGRFLRKYSLDEIPQFLNVLKGEMSIVGPRPLPIKDYDRLPADTLDADWYSKRGDAKPGITGLWQVSGRSNISFEEMCLLDLYYIENQSVFFDLELVFETVPVMFLGKGAY